MIHRDASLVTITERDNGETYVWQRRRRDPKEPGTILVYLLPDLKWYPVPALMYPVDRPNLDSYHYPSREEAEQTLERYYEAVRKG